MAEAVFTFVVNGLSIARLVALDGGYKWASNDLHSEASGRTMDGVMHVVRIGSKAQLDISCIPMSRTDAMAVLRALKATPEFPVTYEDPEYGEPRTATFYCSARNAEYLGRIRYIKWWKHISFTLTEC